VLSHSFSFSPSHVCPSHSFIGQESHHAIVGALVSLALSGPESDLDSELPECTEADAPGEVRAVHGSEVGSGTGTETESLAPARFAAGDRSPVPATPTSPSSPIGGGIGALPEAPRVFAGYEMYESIGMGKYGEVSQPMIIYLPDSLGFGCRQESNRNISRKS
jgi:hypothetical protein